MTVSDSAWDGSASGYADAGAYCDCCLINGNTGDRKDWTKDACKLPYKEPNGDINRNAVHSIASVLAGGMGGLKGVSPSDRKAAAKKTLAMYQNDLKEDAPPSLKKLAQ